MEELLASGINFSFHSFEDFYRLQILDCVIQGKDYQDVIKKGLLLIGKTKPTEVYTVKKQYGNGEINILGIFTELDLARSAVDKHIETVVYRWPKWKSHYFCEALDDRDGLISFNLIKSTLNKANF